MIVIIDSIILFSAAISPNGKISELLFSPLPTYERISCYYAFIELFKHQSKIIKLSKQPIENIISTLYSIVQQINFENEALIKPRFWQEADRLTAYIDSFDISYVAMALQKDGWLWTGDKKLTTHLRKMGFERVVNTNDLYDMLKIR
ncbi:PIN domain-containing protein [Larkinella sp. VNQ87]|uniref:PIN domain-containing protein n=1 Tax=Larkinella sp. VNQ87 TaxID=3400921 RepID=UPI003C0838B9